jgi:hypothetical protein
MSRQVLYLHYNFHKNRTINLSRHGQALKRNIKYQYSHMNLQNTAVKRETREMPKKISIIEKRGWLKLFEEGTLEAAIAHAEHRSLRTIKNGIEDARRESDALLVRSDLLRKAMQDHQVCLMDVIKTALSEVKMPTIDLSLNLPVSVPGPGDGKPEWEFIKSHLGARDPLWKSLQNWGRVMFEHVMDRRNLNTQIEPVVKKHTGYDMTNDIKPPHVYLTTTKTLIYREIVGLASGAKPKKPFEEHLIADPKAGEVMYEKGIALANVPGKEEKCRENIIEAFVELKASYTGDIEKTYKNVAGEFVNLRRALQEISMMGILPGRCGVCKRMGF